MFKASKTESAYDIDAIIDQLTSNIYMDVDAGTTGDIKSDIDNLETLVKIKNLQKDGSKSWRPSPDAVVAAGANLAGIFAIVNYERLQVISTKAIGFITKTRI